jgi:hypothetical protein
VNLVMVNDLLDTWSCFLLGQLCIFKDLKCCFYVDNLLLLGTENSHKPSLLLVKVCDCEGLRGFVVGFGSEEGWYAV